ncbi:hypothetical protein MNQ98_01875 [Paenibacillus sp. N3/727]|uniref:hypothetical protein n=1 Tax=Paenibacillus sp. N3/727 TaxID=2925845 RepID=UPI001F535804|nr:hypothetical protein [Paenibacillus sp. N3/727]UNK18822.1 hypothetical protein MNQ98_01875 [Paenibacillus sp. N3/727]
MPNHLGGYIPMWLLLCMTLLFSPNQAIPQLTVTQPIAGAAQVELFDTDKERVVERFDNSASFQAVAQSLLNSVNGRVMEINPSLSRAMIVKIPLAPPKKLIHKPSGINTTISDVYVIMSRERPRPYMILRTTENEILLVEFAEETAELKKLVHLTP